jgi:hypothetical protein
MKLERVEVMTLLQHLKVYVPVKNLAGTIGRLLSIPQSKKAAGK